MLAGAKSWVPGPAFPTALSVRPSARLSLPDRLPPGCESAPDKADIFELLPQDNEKVKIFRQVLRDYGSMVYLTVAIESRKRGPADEFEDFADEYAKEIRVSPLIDHLEYQSRDEPG